ncbi:MAG TPA: cellulase family glycosylhydrolase, partial [Polyangiaceae bacterium]|nr:cellulase family glycosylhydrolase [Polyangiaceae bacterium]
MAARFTPIARWLCAAVLVCLGCDSGQSSLNSPETEPEPDPDPMADAGTMPGPSTPGGYSVNGNKVVDEAGNVHHFHGLSRPSLEWSVNGENLSTTDYQLLASWGANVVRLPVNQAFYLRNADYPSRIDANIAWAKAAGLDVIIDLHWSDRGTTDPMGGA